MVISNPTHWKEPYYSGKTGSPKYDKIVEMITDINSLASAPPAHKASHQDGGGDEIDVTNLSGLLADDQTPTDHASEHEDTGVDEIDVTDLSGLLADPQTPASHSHPISKTLFDMTEFTLATGEVPSFVKFSPGGTTAMDANTYFKMITTTVLESRKISGDPTSQASWLLCLPGIGMGGVKVTWDWRRTSAWWSASTNFYFSPCFLIWDTVAGDMVWMSTAGRFSNTSSPANYDWQVYNGAAYIDTNQIVPLTTWATVEIEIMPQAYPGDAYAIRFRARTDGGGWTEFRARTDLFTQAVTQACQFMGFQIYCGSSSAFWDLEFRNILVELLDVNWESP